MLREIHVQPNAISGWDVKDGVVCVAHFRQQADAVAFGQRQSRALGVDLVIYHRTSATGLLPDLIGFLPARP